MNAKTMLIGLLAAGFGTIGCGGATPAAEAVAPAGEPVTIGRPIKDVPAWAALEVEIAVKSNAFTESVLDRFVDPTTGKPTFNVHVGQADDAVEGVSTWDRYALLMGSAKTRAGMLRLWQYVYGKMVRNGSFVEGFYKYRYDAEHMGELYQMLWACMELHPHNKELAEQNRKVADAIIDRCYNPTTRLLKHTWLNVSGGEGPATDEILNGMFILAAFRAYMTTGDEKYRRWALEYGGKWNALAAANGGVFPFSADSATGKAPEKWWLGVTKWDYQKQGMNIAARWLHAWPAAMVMMDRGDAKHLAGVKSTLKALFAARADGLPAAIYDGVKWRRPKMAAKGGGYMGWMVKLIDRPYSLVFDKTTGERIQSYYRAAVKAGDEEAGTERRFLSWQMFSYFGEFDEKWAADQFRTVISKAVRRKARAEKAKLPKSGDDLSYLALFRPIPLGMLDGSFFGVYDNGRAGAPHTGVVSYRADDDTPGLPTGLAALVRHVGPDGVHLLLCNTTSKTITVNLTGGFYGQHRIERITEGERRISPAARSVKLAIGPRSLADLKLTMTRYAFKPTLTPVTSKPLAWK